MSDRTGFIGEPTPGPGPWPLSDLVQRYRALVHHPAGCLRVAGASYGTGPASRARARSRCIAEGVERYASAQHRTADDIASPGRLRADGVRHLTPGQLGVAWDVDRPLSWVRSADGTLVPRNAALGHANAWATPTDGVFPQGSTGLAAGPADQPMDRAVAAGAAEVVERDVLARAWDSGSLPRTVLPSDLDAHCVQAGLACSAHLLPTGRDGSVAFVVLRSRGLLGAGAAYRPDPAAGLRKAFVEAVVSLAQAAEIVDPSTGPAVCADAGLGAWQPPGTWVSPPRGQVTDIVEHITVLLDASVQDSIWARLRDQPSAAVTASPGPAATLLLPDAVVIDLTGADCVGHRVCRVLAPGARPVLAWAHAGGDLPCPLI